MAKRHLTWATNAEGQKVKKLVMTQVEPVHGRMCWDCKHLLYFPAQVDGEGDEDTYWNDMKLRCVFDYWGFDQYVDGVAELKKCLTMAEVCGEFEEGSKV